MSQKKVLEYKEEKKNRKEIMAKKKRQAVLGKVVATVAVIAVVGVIGFAVVNNASSKGKGTDANTVSLSSLNNYVSTLNIDQAMASFDDEGADEAKAADLEATGTATDTDNAADSE